jgi:hypothetical protein
MEKGMNIKGELTSRQIVLIVLVIAGLIIGVIFYSLFFQERPDKELCRLSVVERASAPVGKESVPLKCTTEKVCITTKKSEKCKEFIGEENIRYVVLNIPTGNSPKEEIKRDKAVKIIEEETANAMFDCWKMTGEGQLDIFGDKSGLIRDIANVAIGDLALSHVKPKCIVCSRISISESVKEKDKEVKENNIKTTGSGVQPSPSDSSFLSKVDVNDYMIRNKVPGSTLTYLQTFTDENVGGYAEFSTSESKKADGLKGSTREPKKGVSQLAMVFVQIKVPSTPPNDVYWKAFKTGGVVGAGAALTGPGGFVARTAFPIGLLVEAGAVAVASHMYASEAESTAKNNQLMATATCGEYVSNQEKDEKLGCSLVKAISWEVEEINRLCSGGIESNF